MFLSNFKDEPEPLGTPGTAALIRIRTQFDLKLKTKSYKNITAYLKGPEIVFEFNKVTGFWENVTKHLLCS
jgi:hypothetical protein